ncbi:MAG: lipopolysaccharide biosynthesis protein, partial [Deltaproteobacteria bacterium]
MKILDKKTLFDSTNLGQDMARKSVRGGLATLSTQGVQFALTIGSTAVLARLLTPADYGLIGMVTVVVNFAQMFKNVGLSMATVQKSDISNNQISTLFWINLLISVILGFCILAGAPLVALFYGKPELTAVTAVLSLSFVLSGMTIQHRALLQRHMQFGSLATIQIVGLAISIAVTIVLACIGWRYWALVGGAIVLALAETLLTFFFCRWIPERM